MKKRYNDKLLQLRAELKQCYPFTYHFGMFRKKKKCVLIIVKSGTQEDKLLENEDCSFNCIALYLFTSIPNKKEKPHE